MNPMTKIVKTINEENNTTLPFIVNTDPLPQGNNLVDLNDIMAIIKEQKWTIIFVFLIIITLTVTYTYLYAKTVYQADATILIKEKEGRISGFAGLTNGLLGGESGNFIRTQYEMIRSRTLARYVIDDLGLTIATKEGKSGEKISPEEQFLTGLTIVPIERTNLVKINYEAESPDKAAAIVNAIISAAIKLQLANRGSSNSYSIEYLENELSKARTRLTASENKMVTYANKQGILSLDDKQQAPLGRLSSLYKSLGEASTARIRAESTYLQIKKNKNTPDILTNPLINSLKTRLADLESKYEEKSSLFKPDFPDMKILSAQISDLRKQISREIRNTKRSVRTQYLAAKNSEKKVRTDLEAFEQELMVLQDKSIEYNTLKREVGTNRKLYEDLLKKLQEIKISSKVVSSNISVVDAAVAPHKQYRPRPLLNMIVGSFIGLLMGLVVGFLRSSASQKITSATMLQNITGLNVLTSIPKAKGLSEEKLAHIVEDSPNSAVAQAYRILSTTLNYSEIGGRPKIIMVTSAAASEGKSTTAVNLARIQAMSGQKVLLIDADMRRSSIHTKLDIPNNAGLSDYLNDDVDFTKITQHLKDKFYIITGGSLMADPVKLLSTNKIKHFLSIARKYFDCIIIDTPPIIGFADPLILASQVDGVLFVADEGKMEKNTIKRPLTQISKMNRNILGFIITKAKTDVLSNDYYTKYYTKRKPKHFKLFSGSPLAARNQLKTA